MSREPQTLGEFEQQVQLVTRTNRRVARGAVYMTLDRLEKKGLLRSLWDGLELGAGK